MIPNHDQFLSAIREKKVVRMVFYSSPDAGTVDRECMPLDYGPEPAVADSQNRYWIWDPANTAGPNPLGLSPGQIVSMQVLGRNFAPEQLPLGARSWSVVRDWESPRSQTTK